MFCQFYIFIIIISYSLQKLEQLEQELERRPYPDDELSEGSRSDLEGDKKAESPDYLSSLNGQKSDRYGTQLSVEDELRLAADKTKEVRGINVCTPSPFLMLLQGSVGESVLVNQPCVGVPSLIPY